MAELGTLHPTQQHHRQLQAIVQHHSHTSSSSHLPASVHATPSLSGTPIPPSPAVSTMRQSPAPARSERESSTSSSIALPGPALSTTGSLPSQSHGAASVPVSGTNQRYPAPSSVASSAEQTVPTPGDESDAYLSGSAGIRRPSESGSSAALAPTEASSQKRPNVDEGALKKKRRIAPTRIEDADGA
jgi:chromatin assembly factor 1 subunit B